MFSERAYRGRRIGAALACATIVAGADPLRAQETIDVGETGFDVKRPVLASACPQGCPWGELGDFVQEAMEPLGYEVIQCRNCNRAEGPRIVAKADEPPELTAVDTLTGTTTRFDAPVDFGITESGFLDWAYHGRYTYETDGPYDNLRLVAKIEDPFYLLAAVKADSDITDLAQIAEQQLPVRILASETPIAQPVLEHYGITRQALESWGGSMGNPLLAGTKGEFDVIISELATPANNIESSYWTAASERNDLRFLDLDEALLDELADSNLGMQRVTARWGLLRGVDRPIPTVARSGDAVFARDDTPEQAAYDIAKAIDHHRGALKWFIRPYAYDTNTVWQNHDVPLHPGAERYYREMGYLTGDAATASTSQDGGIPDDRAQHCDDGCSISGRRSTPSLEAWVLLALLCLRRKNARGRG